MAQGSPHLQYLGAAHILNKRDGSVEPVRKAEMVSISASCAPQLRQSKALRIQQLTARARDPPTPPGLHAAVRQIKNN